MHRQVDLKEENPKELAKLEKIRAIAIEIDASSAKINVGGDTYAMAFRALHRVSATKMELMPKDW
jgi:hypothetical protein